MERAGVAQSGDSGSKLKSVIVINLDRDAERLAAMTEQLHQRDVDFIRHRAFLGREAVTAHPARFGNCKLSAGEIGCFGSHLDIADKIVSGVYPSPTLVLEDDLDLPDHLADVIAQILTLAPQDWEMIRLSNIPRRGVQTLATFQISRRVYSIVRFRRVRSNTGAYLVNQAGAKKLASLRPAIFPIDQHLKRKWLTRLKSYAVMPIISQSRRFQSTIDVIGQEAQIGSRWKAGLGAHVVFYLKSVPRFLRSYLLNG